ncbi:MAG: AAA family ATPase [Deltaproteobacteria bacterium]|nr:AAA family ATPase [Deltaproteobacteria bacterium]
MSSTAQPLPDFAGTARFEVIRCLGTGSMGVVYEALDRERGKKVALKTLKSLQPEAILRFKNEFRSLQDIHHPNLVALGELLEDHGRWFFTMELISGSSIYEYLIPDDEREIMSSSLNEATVQLKSDPEAHSPSRGNRPISAPIISASKLKSSLVQLAEGLTALHAAHKVHRDIKPSNIMVTRDGRVVLLDFGIVADDREALADSRLTGTVSFMAPEQARCLPVTPAADWYGVGTLLYVALTGQLPFDGSASDVLTAKTTTDPVPPKKLAPGIADDMNDLCMALLSRDPARRATGREVLRRLTGDARSPSSTLPIDVFVGRHKELQAIGNAFERTLGGHPVTLLVRGESGIGKSALVRRFLGELSQNHPEATVLMGRCFERETVPYKAFDAVVDALSRVLAKLGPELAQPLLPRQISLLCQVFPVLRQGAAACDTGPEPGAVDPHQIRARLFSGLREFMGRLLQKGPLVILIDDLQWADADSLALLASLLRPPDAPALLLMATVRTASSGQVGLRTPEELAECLPGKVEDLHLDKLEGEEARLLVTELAERSSLDGPATVDVETIVKEANGHPLFIDALLRFRLAHGQGSAPVRLDDAIWQRVVELSQRDRKVLELVAIAGTPLAQETIAHAAGADLSEYLQAAATLRLANLAKTGGLRRSDTIEPFHDRIRESVLSRLSEDALRAGHRRLATAMNTSFQPDPAKLAHHWLAAGEKERARHWSVIAADHAAEALAFDRAAELYQRSIELAGDGKDARLLKVKLAQALANAGLGAESARAFLDAEAGAEPREALELRGFAADQLLRSGRLEEGASVLKSLLPAVGLEFPKTPTRALLSVVQKELILRVRGLGFRERKIDEIPPGKLLVVDALRAATAFNPIDNIRGRHFTLMMLFKAFAAGEPVRVAHALSHLAMMKSGVGGPRALSQAAGMIGRAEEILAGREAPDMRARLVAAKGISAYFAGKWDVSRALTEEAIALFQDKCTGVAFELASVRHFHTNVLSLTGDLLQLARSFRERVREAMERGDRYAATCFRTGYGNIHWLAQDDPEGLRADVEDATRSFAPQGFHLQHYYALVGMAQSYLYQGDAARALGLMEEQMPALRKAMFLHIQGIRIALAGLRGRLSLALAARARGHESTALLAAARADIKRLLRERLPWATALARFLSAGVSHLAGDRLGALEALGEAVDLFEGAGMLLHAACARWQKGRLQGGDQGDMLVQAASGWMLGQSVRRPERMVYLLAPGFG